MSSVAESWDTVQAQIAGAARRAGREPADVRVVAATKTVSAERIAELLEAGCTELGENRAQELLAKASVLAEEPRPPEWHFIGPLQRNKVKPLAQWVSMWQTVDRPAVATAIATHAPGAAVLIEVNLAGEPQKAGCSPAEVDRLVDFARGAGLDVAGLMTVPPLASPPRRWFAGLADLADRFSLRELSMGMSDDFEVAIEEGATIVRLGRVLFGERPLG
jgi:PLP dependent protein